MDIDLLWLVLIVTPLVMAVIILVIGVLFFRALRQPTRDALARQRAQQEAGGLEGGRDSWTGVDDDGGHPTEVDRDADAPSAADDADGPGDTDGSGGGDSAGSSGTADGD